jgi:hypothetical protein
MADQPIGGIKLEITGDIRGLQKAVADGKISVDQLGKFLEQRIEKGTTSAERSVNRLVKELTGVRPTAQLQQLGVALQKIGGTAKLTEVQVGNLQRKIEGLRSAGGTVPASLQNIATSAAGVGKAFEGIKTDTVQRATGNLGSLGTALGALGPAGMVAAVGLAAVTAGLGAVVAAGAGLAKLVNDASIWADKIKDTSIATGMSVESVQRLEHAAALAEVSLEQVTSAVIKMQRAMIEAPEKFTALGLSMAQLREMAPEEQLVAVADKLKLIEDPALRNAAAVDILGKSWADLAPLIMDGLGAMKDANVMSADTIGQLDELRQKTNGMSAAWDQMWVALGAAAGKEPAIVGAIDAITGAMTRLGKALKDSADKKKGSFLDSAVHALSGLQASGAIGGGLVGSGLAASVTLPLQMFAAQAAPALPINPAEAGRHRVELEAEKAAMAERLRNAKAEEEAKKAADKATEKLVAREKELTGARIAEAAAIDRSILRSKGVASFTDTGLKDLSKYAGGPGNDVALAALKEIVKRQRPEGMAFPKATPMGIQELMPSGGTGLQFELSKLASGTMWPTALRPLKISMKETSDSMDAVNEKTVDWHQQLAAIADITQILGSNFGSKILGGVAGIGGALKTLKTGMADGLTGGAGLFSTKGLSSLLGNAATIGQIASIGLSLGKAVADALITKASAFEHVGKHWGTKISEGLAEQIDKDAKEKFGGDIETGALSNLGAIFGEAGGVEKFGTGAATGKVRDLFSAVEQGKLSLSQAGDVFDEVFGEVAAANISKSTGLASDGLKELVDLAKRFGLESEALQDFMKGQATGLAGNLAGGLGSLKASREKGGPGLVSQGAATGISAALVGDFAAMREAGLSQAEAIGQITPAIQAMREELTAAGLEGSAAFLALEQQVGIFTDEVTGPLVSGIGSFSGALVNMNNMGLLTQETFAGITAQIGANIEALAREGVEGPAAVAALQPELQKIWEIQQKTGLQVDETTQNLIDQAVAAGAVGEQHRSAQEVMRDAMLDTRDAIVSIAEAMGALPKDIKFRVHTEYTESGHRPGEINMEPIANLRGGGGGGEELESRAIGSPNLEYWGTGTPVMLHDWEAVMTPGALESLVSSSIDIGVAAAAGQKPVSMGGNDEMLQELRGLRAEIARLPRAVAIVSRDLVQQSR